jgi:hypothetical protein
MQMACAYLSAVDLPLPISPVKGYCPVLRHSQTAREQQKIVGFHDFGKDNVCPEGFRLKSEECTVGIVHDVTSIFFLLPASFVFFSFSFFFSLSVDHNASCVM